jgi:hypothetical protein
MKHLLVTVDGGNGESGDNLLVGRHASINASSLQIEAPEK